MVIERKSQHAGPAPGSELLLVVEDEAPVRELVQRSLEGFGYTVLVAANAEEATRLFRAHRDDIALLISDVVIPGVSGPALYKSLAEEAPHLKALFLSGYTPEVVQERGVLEDAPFLPKPFTLSDLARTVRRVLDA
jgi:DNA-binding NtrC family response regulator